MAESDDTQILYKKKINMNSNISNECFFYVGGPLTHQGCADKLSYTYIQFIYTTLVCFWTDSIQCLSQCIIIWTLSITNILTFLLQVALFFLSHSGNLSSVKDINYILFFFYLHIIFTCIWSLIYKRKTQCEVYATCLYI